MGSRSIHQRSLYLYNINVYSVFLLLYFKGIKKRHFLFSAAVFLSFFFFSFFRVLLVLNIIILFCEFNVELIVHEILWD